MARKIKPDTALTTAQQLGSLIKSARDIMRKDKGLNGDLDRLPMLTWIMFLKFLDDAEQMRETEARLQGKRFRRAIEPPYRWRDWAAKEDGITGDELIAFINQDEANRPDATRGPGLFAYLRSLQGANGGDRRDVIATVFKGTVNRMQSGYLLRDVLNRINTIHFTSSEEIHTLGLLYESLLKEMRDAAGDSGEFYTPRPVIRFVVTVMNLRLGETVLDPAAGTGGFLVEAFEHLKKQCKKTEDNAKLQRGSLFGIEAKPMPYLLCQMNLLLHGLESPDIDPGNALRFPLREIGDRDRVDVIMTNPPFGGEEERGIIGNFPEDKQTTETALLFLQLIMRKLRRPVGGQRGGRCGLVVPNGMLFGDGVCARIKEELLENFNLHTIVRLPSGVFAHYTDQETALMFFDRDCPTSGIWYYEHLLPPERRLLKNPRYTKSKPLAFEEFAPLITWWHKREVNECARYVPVEKIKARGFNLDIRHPKHREQQLMQSKREVCASLEYAVSSLTEKSKRLLEILRQSERSIGIKREEVRLRTIADLGVVINPEARNPAREIPDKTFRYIDLSSVSLNTFKDVKELPGAEAPSRARRVIREGDVILATVRPYLCGHAVVPPDLDGEICSTGFAVLRCPASLSPRFLYYMLISPPVIAQFLSVMRGAHYPALKDEHVQDIQIPDLPLEEQRALVAKLDELHEEILPIKSSLEASASQLIENLAGVFPAILCDLYGSSLTSLHKGNSKATNPTRGG